MGVFDNFPYANFHELNADWILEQVRKVTDDWEAYKTSMDEWKLRVDDELAEFQAWFDNLDVQDEVRTVINELIQSGEFIEITSPQIVSATEAWLAAHITPTTPAVDDTLSISGAAADAKVTGDWITGLNRNSLSVDMTDQYRYGYNKYINLAQSIGTVIDIDNPSTSQQMSCAVIPCKAGDWFILTGAGGQSARLWGFLDSDKKLLSVSTNNATETNIKHIAEEDGYFVSNIYRNVTFSVEWNYYLDDFADKRQFTKIDSVMEIPNHYYSVTDGLLHYIGNNFSVTNKIRVNPGDILKITTAVGDTVGIVGYDINKVFSSRIADTNTASLYTFPSGVKNSVIIVPENVYYVTVSNVLSNDTKISIESNNPYCNQQNPVIPILVVPCTTTSFWVYIKAEEGYLKHTFVKQYYSDTLTYGENQTATVVGADIWYSTVIMKDDVNVMAGNFNFIHYIDNMEGHNGYVGAGHGCIVADYTNFYIDDDQFNPSITTIMDECEEFSFIIKAKNYLIDKPNSPSESHAVPTLDSNGNPIVTSLNIINAVMKPLNNIEYRNRLVILMDGIRFRECHGSMCEGYFTAFDNVIISDSEESWNYLDSEDDYARIKLGNTTVDIFNTGKNIANNVIMFGDGYKVENKLIQSNGARNAITNTRAEIYRTNGPRMKIYLMPVVCSISSTNIAKGQAVETFNNGDIIDVTSIRKITV